MPDRPRQAPLSKQVILLICCSFFPTLVTAQAKPTAQPPAAAQAKKPATGPSAPQSRHYPILLIASGTEPFWSLRLGMKGPERLERVGYPPITLEPAEIDSAENGTAWTYHAKDTGTEATVLVQVSRESCSDNMSDTKYPFRVAVQHAQIGELKGCARIAPDQFPEFKQKNLDDDDPDKKKVTPPVITNFKTPTAVAYVDATGRVVLARGETPKVIAPKGYQLSLAHDGKRLLFTRDGQGTDRSIVLYDSVSGKSTDLLQGLVQEAYWSPDDSKFAFLKNVDGKWRVWTASVSNPTAATQLFGNEVAALHGWVSPQTVLASDMSNLFWIGESGQATQTLSLRDIYGEGFSPSSSDSIVSHPLNPDLLLVGAENLKPGPGAVTDPKMGMASSVFYYEIRSKRRVLLSPVNLYSQDGEWSRDGVQIFFTGRDATKVVTTYRIFWDGSGLKKFKPGTAMVVGQ